MASQNRTTASDRGKAIIDIPSNAPTIGTATDLAADGQVSVAFTAPSTIVGGPITSYKTLSNPGSIVGTGTTSPIIVTGLTNGTSYTFTVAAVNSTGNGPYSSASNSVTPTTPPVAYYSLASSTLSAAGSSTTISSIDQTFQHLVIRLTVYGTGSSESNYSIRFNGDTGANYNYNLFVGDGGSQAALSTMGDTLIGWGYTYGNWGLTGRPPVTAQFIIPNYSLSTNYKSMVEYEGVTGASVGGAQSLAAVWKSTNAINSITLLSSGNNMEAGSTIAVYGIKGS